MARQSGSRARNCINIEWILTIVPHARISRIWPAAAFWPGRKRPDFKAALPPTALAGGKTPRAIALLAAVLGVLCVSASAAHAQAPILSGGKAVLSADALLTTPVGGLERTNATAKVIPVSGGPFTRGLRVTVRTNAPETNATQLTMPISVPVAQGDVLLASFYVRGASATGAPAQVELLFERSVDPWTKSVTYDATTPTAPRVWKRVLVPFTAAESYRPGEAMVSLRFAFGPQAVEVAGLRVVDFGRSQSVEELIGLAAAQNPLGRQTVAIHLSATKQPMIGLGGNFTAPRYGATEPFDAVARYNLDHLRIVHARIGIPLNTWALEKDIYRDEGPAHAAFLQLQEFARRKIPVVASIWEGPAWLLPGKAEQEGRRLPQSRYGDCIEAIVRFLVTARDKYGAAVENFSFNEADYGVNFKFTPEEIIAFIRQAGPRFQQAGLQTKFLVGDTGGGAGFASYARPLLEDKTISEYLGPLAFHCWDVLGTPAPQYEAIAALGREFHKPIWCTEAGWDAGLWQKPDPWASWENALNTARAYVKTLRLSGAQIMDYWTYEDDYPLVNKDGQQPYPVWYVVRQMQEALRSGSKIASASVTSDDLEALATTGPHAGQFSVLLVNPIGAGQVILSGLPANAEARMEIITAGDGKGPPKLNRLNSQRANRTGHLVVDIPARSVVSILSSKS
ncbi:MAG TPA: hypothetical protein VFA07_12530 [Chthonomonadaceae bacterium]|nr:hypothetical protein [Chthonomonadaceae bacterium]